MGHPDSRDRARQWESRPWAARAVRLTIAVLPFAAATLGAWQVHLMLGTPESFPRAVAQWIVLSAAAMGTIILFDRGLRMFLPLPALLKMSLVFPEEAPSRFRSALRRGTTRKLEREVQAGKITDGTPQEAAEHLLDIVTRLTDHDRRTRGHTERVRAYADMIADEMNISEEERQKLHWGALIHDIGKLRVPASILNKDGLPTEREWTILQTHPIEGWHMLGPLRGWLGEWARATRDHHEKWDGTGYPTGRWGENISLAGRIVAVADAYDVMTSTRSYKPPIRPDEARAELTRCAGSHFDPEVVRAFLAISLRHQRTATGPLSSAAQSPILLRASSLAQVPATAASGALAAAIAVGTMLAPVGDEPAAPQAAREVPFEEPAETTTTTSTTTTTTTTEAPSTTTEVVTPTSTVTPPPTTTAPPPAPTTTSGTVAPVPPPTTTTTAAPPPTTTAPPPTAFDLGYLGGGTSGAPLVASVSGGGTVNWDSELNGDPGLTLPRHPDGLIELSAPHVMTWTAPLPADVTVGSSIWIDLWVATAGYDTDALGILLGGVGECTRPTSGCTTVATGSQGFLQSDFGGDFGRISIHLDATPHTLSAGSHLVVAVAAPTSSMADVWIAYGTTDRASQIRI